ncbi:hypothetical protein N7448_006859 [Penicillium atrosanguineum]|uniref:AMP-activated protein kinase glycogen-binding domain-containing protein n=1 Tax=Penicillium atrosanguineum TaxID=1132637 RepID=A0A9W9PSS9_9EURO|nr:uncharacterized protein N7443_010622 [Penicillium atrosanguineum]KAJ5132701.1 hypothetical protein N7448_006859 [Penicillium atrosanguineum]KAJ5141409.1 hypothetical protein N7526_002404 [Penicillium atrosanguineum]KAJ5290369.1 hypothetical protein N7443_010622 [Penicillium atrosanguineum]KAJ5308191.1 hypothetical protein N7476_008847 [Penicillium atrosanguineum]
MGIFTFQWPYDANDVYVTGTFDDWGKTVKLDRVSDGFAKEVSLPIEKVHYKFVVDGIWTTDSRVREEIDGHNNVNNVLLPEEIQDSSRPAPATMSGVTPDSTTAALAADVPKEKANGEIPGSFPETPAQESEQILSVNPIPASGGYGNPIKLNPGEKVPDLSSVHGNTVESTVKLDKESYEKGDSLPLGTQPDTATSSAFAVPPVSKNLIPESSLPMGGPAQRAAMNDQQTAADPGYTIQSAAPTSTTAALAAEVPLEKNKQPASDRDYTTQSAAPTSTTAALAGAVPLESSKQTNGTKPVEDVPEVVKESITNSHQSPEAAANKEAVEEKKEVEQELRQKVNLNESAGTPAPTLSAATQPTAPGLAAGLAAPGFDSADVSPMSTPPPGRSSGPAPTSTPATATQTGPVVTDGPVTVPTDTVSTPKPAKKSSTTETAGTTTTSEGSSKDDKKKKRRSWFSKLKEKLK